MTKEELLEITSVPTLHSVVETGDKSIIQTTRLSQVEEEETDLDEPDSYYPDSRSGVDDPDIEDELELLIDDVVDRHIIALRKDIRSLLEEALSSRDR